MTGLDIAVVSEGDNRLVCKGTIIRMQGNRCLLEAYTAVYPSNRKVSLIIHGANMQTLIYEGEISSILGDTVLVEDVHLVSRSERRRSRRYHTFLRSLVISNNEDFTVEIQDVSEHGMLIVSPQELQIQNMIAIQTPLHINGEEYIFSSQGKVVRCTNNKYGIQLVNMTHLNKKVYTNFIRRECT